MKKFVSLLLVLTMLVTVFAGLAVTASAAVEPVPQASVSPLPRSHTRIRR